ncbi:hypothetical protein IQ249_17350 [Lusitaniella coriacea LEGE 07157]|uniref:Uncharacterized protein n=1 Tax=Lusitaniella coriacea LEGE 07157 TaxID=945747 RepID=A0A8J7DY92_9CYAN|nr:hypothetical protein [Lusitaniella coriacea]MBE9117666.1 hypothetical protein [Lusitaniella coriacea LEGE 07157]
MKIPLIFIAKVLFASAALSFTIKYGGRFFPLEATATNAIIAVTLPPFAMMLVLFWRLSKNRESSF